MPLQSPAAAATTGRSVLHGGLWTAASKLLPQVYVVIVSVVAARFLGPDGMGQQSFIAFALMSTILVFTGGLPVALMRFVGESVGAGRPGVVRTLMRWAWALELWAALLGALLLVVVGVYRPELRSAWIAAGVACALAILHTVPSAVLVGLQRFRQLSVVSMTTGLMSVFLTIAVLAAGYGITGMFVVEVLLSLVNLLWASRLAKRALAELDAEAEPADDVKKRILPYAGWVSLNLLLTFVVWRRSEFFFLAAYSPDAQLAFYSIAFGAVAALLKITNIASGVAAPAVATLLGGGERERLSSGVARASRLTLHLALPLTALVLALSPLLVRLAYGADFAPAASVLLVLLVSVPLIALTTFSGSVLSGLGVVKPPLAWAAVATVVNVLAAVLLVPRHGALGAAVANGLAQAVAGVPQVVMVRRRLPGVRLGAANLVRMAVAGGVAAAAARAGSELGGWGGLLCGAGLGVAALAAGLLLLRPLATEDVRWLAGALGRGDGSPLSRALLRIGAADGTR